MNTFESYLAESPARWERFDTPVTVTSNVNAMMVFPELRYIINDKKHHYINIRIWRNRNIKKVDNRYISIYGANDASNDGLLKGMELGVIHPRPLSQIGDLDAIMKYIKSAVEANVNKYNEIRKTKVHVYSYPTKEQVKDLIAADMLPRTDL